MALEFEEVCVIFEDDAAISLLPREFVQDVACKLGNLT